MWQMVQGGEGAGRMGGGDEMHAPFSFAIGIVVVEEDVVSLLRALGVAALRTAGEQQRAAGRDGEGPRDTSTVQWVEIRPRCHRVGARVPKATHIRCRRRRAAAGARRALHDAATHTDLRRGHRCRG